MVEPRVTTYPVVNSRDVPSLVMEDGLQMEPVRCPKCGCFLFYQAIVIGAARAKCKNCRLWITLDIIPPPEVIEEEVEEA